MMKKIFNLMLVFALTAALAGCSPDQRAYKKYSGTWVLKDATVQDDETATNAIAAALAIVKLFGGEITMELKDDGTGSFGILTDTDNITWNAKTITMEDKQYTYTVRDGQMILNIDEKNTAAFAKKTE